MNNNSNEKSRVNGIAPAGKSVIYAKGCWISALIAVPVIGSVFYNLKAELECARSMRERQFLLRMICLRFFVAAFVMFGGVIVISFEKSHIDMMAIGSLIGCFLLAVFVAARTLYFHYRRRQIQIEEGVLEDFDHSRPAKTDGLLSDLFGKTSKANSFSALSAIFGFIGCLVLIPLLSRRVLASGYWTVAVLLLIWGAFNCVLWLRNWRQRPRRVFDARFRMIAGPVIAYALLSLVFFDLLWMRGCLRFHGEWCLFINPGVMTAYAALIKVLALWQNTLADFSR